jgi:molecular chaperone HscB
LHEYGVDVTNEDNSANTTDPATLMEVMEAQEGVEVAETQADVDALKSENRLRITDTEVKMARAFEQGDADTARRECVRLKYWRSLQQGLDDWEAGKEVRLVH